MFALTGAAWGQLCLCVPFMVLKRHNTEVAALLGSGLWSVADKDS